MKPEKRTQTRTLRAVGAAALLAAVASCGSGQSENSSELQGEFVAYAGMTQDGSGAQFYSLRVSENQEIALEFAAAPNLTTGTRIRVSGEAVGDRKFRVEHFDIVQPEPDGVGKLRQAVTVVNGVTTRRIAILMLEFNGPNSITQQDLRNTAFSASNSVDAFYNENSYGKLRLAGDVFGWLHIPTVDCNDSSQISGAGAQAASAANIDLSQYDHVAHYIPNCPGFFEAGFSGLGEIGTPASPARNTWLSNHTPALFAHELGHNLGFLHSNTYFCDNGSTTISTPEHCISQEYGDTFTVMGFGAYGDLDPYSRAAQNWFANCNLVTTPRTSAFTLAPTETVSTGVQALRIPLSPALCPGGQSPCYYYLETRRPLGVFDGAPVYSGTPMFDGVLLRAGAAIDPTGTSVLRNPQLLDAVTSTGVMEGIGNGKVFTDPSGIRMKVLSQTTSSTRFAVRVPSGTGSPTCLNGSAFTQNASCYNGALSSGETAIDCGGPNCAPCEEGQTCSLARDCWSGVCTSGRCVASCSDGFRDGSESDLDCGGSCNDCLDGKTCNAASDCIGGTCANGICKSLLVATLHVHSNWTTGYCAIINLENTASVPTKSWTVEATIQDSSFTSTSGAVFTPAGGGIYRLTPASWNATIWPSSNNTISFCANKTGPNSFAKVNWVSPQY